MNNLGVHIYLKRRSKYIYQFIFRKSLRNFHNFFAQIYVSIIYKLIFVGIKTFASLSFIVFVLFFQMGVRVRKANFWDVEDG